MPGAYMHRAFLFILIKELKFKAGDIINLTKVINKVRLNVE